jgi:hypothetical protein
VRRDGTEKQRKNDDGMPLAFLRCECATASSPRVPKVGLGRLFYEHLTPRTQELGVITLVVFGLAIPVFHRHIRALLESLGDMPPKPRR